MDGHELRRTLDVHNLIARAYRDDRFPARRGSLGADVRMFAITTMWVVGIERAPKGERWKRVCEILHLNDYRFWETIRADLPRYEPDDKFGDGTCEAPMIRREGLCGKRGGTAFRVTNPSDGRWRIASFCTRHEEQARQVHQTEMRRQNAGTLPEPLPNAGGLLPCYIRFRWPDLYAKADPGWKPPAIGIRADDWPVTAKVAQLEAPRLQVVVSGIAVGQEPLPDESTPPTLRIVHDDE